VIGASIAYFLGLRGIVATVVERTGIASAASGKSGGFLAHDWCEGDADRTLDQRRVAHARTMRSRAFYQVLGGHDPAFARAA